MSEGWHGVRFAKPLARTREYVEVLRLALSRQKVDYHGATYEMPLPDGPGKALHLMLHPVRERIPIYLAAIGPKNLELTGEIADGWLPVFFAPEHAEDSLAHLDAGLAAAGRDRSGFDIAPTVPLVVGRRRRRLRRPGPRLRGALRRRDGQPDSRTSTTRWPAGWASPTRRPASRTCTSPGATRRPRRRCRWSSSTAPRCSARSRAWPSGWPRSRRRA